MRKFLIRFLLFLLVSACAGEIIIRAFKLTSEIPERYVDKWGIQRYTPGQSGHYKKADYKWKVNDFGWMGMADTSKDTIVSIIGDSYIENMMNPIECNQGSILKTYFPGYSFFEVGRSGISFIEAMEIAKHLDSEINPAVNLLYISNKDFYESIADIQQHKNVMQVDLKHQQIIKGALVSPGLKKILYNSKLFYYLYIRFPIFVDKQNMGEIPGSGEEKIVFDYSMFNSLFEFCAANYNKQKIVFVFHPGSKKEFVALAQQYGFKSIVLDSSGDKSWAISTVDEHWSCYGHHQIATQIKQHLSESLLPGK